jgi:hypothetical protein
MLSSSESAALMPGPMPSVHCKRSGRRPYRAASFAASTSFSQQLDLLDWERATSVTLPNEAVLALSEQLCQLLVELTDRQSPLNDPNQEASE